MRATSLQRKIDKDGIAGDDYSVLRATAGRKRSTSGNGVGRVRISMKHLAFNRLLVTQIPFATRSWSMQKTVFGS
jgi:hypothetical protein